MKMYVTHFPIVASVHDTDLLMTGGIFEAQEGSRRVQDELKSLTTVVLRCFKIV